MLCGLKQKSSFSIMYVVFQCEHSYIQVHVVTLVHYNIISKTPDTLQLLYYSNTITLATCYKQGEVEILICAAYIC